MGMRVFSADQLSDIGTKLFVASGVKEAVAREVVQSLVLSNLLGVDSHGIVRMKNYCDAIQAGAIVPDAEAEVVRDSGPTVLIDGRKSFGHIAAKKATHLAMQKACEYGIGAASFTNVFHIGRLGEYVSIAAEQGLIAIMMANGSRAGGLVAPFGARERRLGTNPIAFAIPAGTQPTLLADFSTSSIAEGRVRLALRNHKMVPSGCLIDREGKSTNDPADLYDGGAILTFGDYKGYALSLLVEVLGGILSGAETPIFPNYGYLHNGVFIFVIDPACFRPQKEYPSSVDFLFAGMKQALPAAGMSGALIPGEPETQRKIVREQEGIPIDDHTWAEILELAATLKVSIPGESSQSAEDVTLDAGS
jgi:LDH2 family malate/lactate/ureidoglycolate dehydrogenase